MRSLFTLMLMGLVSCLAAQSPFSLRGAQAVLPLESEADLYIQDYQGVTVDLDALRLLLQDAPLENTNGRSGGSLSIDLPTPEGDLATFQLVESSVFHPDLQARHPLIRSYRLFGAEGNGRMAVSPQGVVAMLPGYEGDYFITQAAEGNAIDHLAYYIKDMDMAVALGANELSCGHDAAAMEEWTSAGSHDHDHEESPTEGSARTSVSTLQLSIFDMALTCTAEFANSKGGTIAGVNAAFNEALTVMNVVYENELGARFQLIPNNDTLIFFDPETDPYINVTNGGGLLGQIKPAFTMQGIGPNQYDVGHIFTRGCEGGLGGIAGGLVCREETGKERGVTCHSSGNVAAITNRIMTHEIGHQFTAGHSWNICPGNFENQRSSDSAYEPGSGSTIMSYAGSCGNQNIVGNNDNYFHVHSLQEMMFWSRELNPECATLVGTVNNEPVLTLEEEDGFFIPISTPFILRGSATDADNDPLTYTWEQYDLGPLSALGNPSLNAPIFRSRPPSSTRNVRYLPSRGTVINNNTDVRELLPTYERDLTFRFVVRDNNEDVGSAVWETLAFHVDGESGPFLVDAPNVGNENWEAGQLYEVNWDVANTDQAPVNCQIVDIELSTDGGFTFPHLLASGVANNGSAEILVPVDITSTAARIRVLAADNIFYDMSNANFTVSAPSQPGVALGVEQLFQQVCLPDEAVVDLEAISILDFSNEVNLSVTSTLPDGATASFTDNTIMPGQNSQLSIDFGESSFSGELVVSIEATADGAPTVARNILVDVVNNDFSDLVLTSPGEGEGGIILSTDFDWTDASFADEYEIEIATEPTFNETTIFDRATGLINSTYTPDAFFEPSLIYFWRVRPVNACGLGPWMETQSFQTALTSCDAFEATDVPVGMPGQGPGFTVTSSILVDRTGTLSDVNIPNININYDAVRFLTIALVSPTGTRVTLYNEECPNFSIIFNSGFDDQAPNVITCPPDDGIVFEPVEPLSDFEGEELFGTWTLEVSASETQGSAGAINSWDIEFCAASSPSSPELITLETLECPPAGGNSITDATLEATDPINGPEDLTYLLIRTPRSGFLERNGDGSPLLTGDSFTQAEINGNVIGYRNTNEEAMADSWRFIVTNPEGGYIPITEQPISIFDGATTGTSGIIQALGVELFPNPVEGRLDVRWAEGLDRDLPLVLYDQTGRRLLSRQLQRGQSQIALELGELPAGTYWLRIDDEALPVVKR